MAFFEEYGRIFLDVNTDVAGNILKNKDLMESGTPRQSREKDPRAIREQRP